MSELKPMTATEIVRLNQEYWESKGPELARARQLLEKISWHAIHTVEDIMHHRTKAGWPTRDAAAPEEGC